MNTVLSSLESLGMFGQKSWVALHFTQIAIGP